MQSIAHLALPAALLVTALSVPVKGETTEGIIAFFSYGARMVEAFSDLVMLQPYDALAPVDVAASSEVNR